MKPIEMVKIAYEALNEKKAEDIKVIEIGSLTVIADYFIIANGTNANQVQTLVDNVAKEDRLFYDLERIWRDGKEISKEDLF